jgi:hypothetical protein
MQPDFVWVKSRNAAYNNYLYDSIRGATNALRSNTADAESQAGNSTLTTTTNGFTVTGTGLGVNSNGTTIVGWQWKANGAGVTNTAGTITSTVSANTTSGFSVVTFTGNGSTGTVGHGLGVAPSMIIQKPRSAAGSWAVYHASLGAGNAVWLNLTDAVANYPTVWNSTAPTSTLFSVGSYMGTATYVSYCFAPVAGYSAFGIYTGNGADDGTFVYTGFAPKYVLIKRSNAADQWLIKDSVRQTYNVNNTRLTANDAFAESTGVGGQIDFLSNGFKNRSSNDLANLNGGTYIYAAFAENPFKFANAR